MSSDIGFVEKLRFIAESFEWREFRARVRRCPICGPTLFLKLEGDQLGTRCVRCGASPIALGLIAILRHRHPDLSALRVYEASSRGPVYEFLRERAGEFMCSEYFDDTPPGELRDGVRCEDLQALSFEADAFDLCTSTEVFEHVPDDAAGFAELLRVLRPGGDLIFTIPLHGAERTVERAHRIDDEIEYRLEPVYHDDRIRGRGGVLVFRDYGHDVVDRLLDVGFESARIEDAGDVTGMGHRSPVVVATKAKRNRTRGG